jgi:Fe-S oxidoreductase
LDQALGAGAEVLATSCPYCITHFEESRIGLEDSEAIEIKDITEIIREMI